MTQKAKLFPSTDAIFRKGRELAAYRGELWDELSGADKNKYYVEAQQVLMAERLMLEEEK